MSQNHSEIQDGHRDLNIIVNNATQFLMKLTFEHRISNAKLLAILCNLKASENFT